MLTFLSWLRASLQVVLYMSFFIAHSVLNLANSKSCPVSEQAHNAQQPRQWKSVSTTIEPRQTRKETPGMTVYASYLFQYN